MNISLQTPIEEISSFGRKLSPYLKKLQIETVKDLLFYFPFRYEDFSQIIAISELQPHQRTTVKGTVELIKSYRSPKRRKLITEAIVSDKTGRIKVIWFNQSFVAKILRQGDEVYLAGVSEPNIFGAQLFAKFKKDSPNWQEELEKGNLKIMINWLKENVLEKGNIYDPFDLVKEVTGEEVSSKYLIDYYEEKFSKIYDLN